MRHEKKDKHTNCKYERREIPTQEKAEHKRCPQKGHQGIPALKTAAQDAKHLEAGFRRITYSKHEIGR